MRNLKKSRILLDEKSKFQELEAACDCDSASDCTTYHRVVSHSHEAHHLDVRRNR